jgi:hypothetical protein
MPETFAIRCEHLDALLDQNEVLVDMLVEVVTLIAPDWQYHNPAMAALVQKMRREVKATRASLEAYRSETP